MVSDNPKITEWMLVWRGGRGRLQVKIMEINRKVERARRTTEGLMDRNAALGKLLEDIEKGKPENLKDNEVEKARRGEVVKIMKLELKVMERERLLESSLRLIKDWIMDWKKAKDLLESSDQDDLTFERELDSIDRFFSRLYKNKNLLEKNPDMGKTIDMRRKGIEEAKKKMPDYSEIEARMDRLADENNIEIGKMMASHEEVEDNIKEDESEVEKFR